MDKYILRLSTNNYTCSDFDLFLQNKYDDIDDVLKYGDTNRGYNYVYNDREYEIKVFDTEGKQHTISRLYINGDRVKLGYSKLFFDCFGIIKIAVTIDENTYITNNISVMFRKSYTNRYIIDMIDYIYEKCDKYLYTENRVHVRGGKVADAQVSLTSKLTVLDSIYEAYLRFYGTMQYSAQSKPINTDKIGDFSELQNISPATIRYIVSHPEELRAVNYNSGIVINKQNYQPNKTLVKSVGYSYNTYENRVVVGFIRTILNELQSMRKKIDDIHKSVVSPRNESEYIESYYYIYNKNNELLRKYMQDIISRINRFQQLYRVYKKILDVDDFMITAPPKYTNVFRTIMPYNVLFRKMIDWFKSGDIDTVKSNLLLSFVSTSKIYEYFCLIKINEVFEQKGFDLINGYCFKYARLCHIINEGGNNTFEFVKGDLSASAIVYFQPVIYGRCDKLYVGESRNGINLYRNTSWQLKENDENICLEAPNSEITGNSEFTKYYYTPDYVIKLRLGDTIKYYILDAKYSTLKIVKQKKMLSLIFKYLFSVSTISTNEKLAGMCILSGKNLQGCYENVYDISKAYSLPVTPSVNIISLPGSGADDGDCLAKYIEYISANI